MCVQYAQHTLYNSTLPSNLPLASGHLGTLDFLTFIITRESGTKWTRGEKRRKSEEVLLSGAQYSEPDTHVQSDAHTLPVPDPHVTLRSFQHLRNPVSEATLPNWTILSVRVCMCMDAYMHACILPQLSPPSLDKNYIIAVCDLIFLKEDFEVFFPLLHFLLPPSLTWFWAVLAALEQFLHSCFCLQKLQEDILL